MSCLPKTTIALDLSMKLLVEQALHKHRSTAGEAQTVFQKSRLVPHETAGFRFQYTIDSDPGTAIFELDGYKARDPDVVSRVSARGTNLSRKGVLPTDFVTIRKISADASNLNINIILGELRIGIKWEDLFSRVFGGEKLIQQHMREANKEITDMGDEAERKSLKMAYRSSIRRRYAVTRRVSLNFGDDRWFQRYGKENMLVLLEMDDGIQPIA